MKPSSRVLRTAPVPALPKQPSPPPSPAAAELHPAAIRRLIPALVRAAIEDALRRHRHSKQSHPQQTRGTK